MVIYLSTHLIGKQACNFVGQGAFSEAVLKLYNEEKAILLHAAFPIWHNMGDINRMKAEVPTDKGFNGNVKWVGECLHEGNYTSR